ncbi:MAG: hypothetical protein P4L46_09625 [Fimbriimonas sp.]|nr:hypothetical protein [Fimbriimonas sp.]
MHTEKREDPLVELGYEIRDVNKKALVNGTIGFFVFAIASSVIGFVIFRLMYPAGFDAQHEPKSLMPQSPNPLVQSNITAKTDIMDLRQQEDKVLNAPAHWVDASHTKIAIPIDRAMEIIADRGMPKTTPDVPAVTKGHTPDPVIGEKVPAPRSVIGAVHSSTVDSTPAKKPAVKH